MSDSATSWTAARQASLSFTIPQSLLKLMSIELVMPSNYLILCLPLLLSSVFPTLIWNAIIIVYLLYISLPAELPGKLA